MAKLFISYRRNDTAAYAGRVYDRLRNEFGRDNVFIDVAAIEPGDDFVDAIDRTLASCDLMLVIIGQRWLRDSGDQGSAFQRPDYVTTELEHAFSRGLRTIPVLVDDARMPDVSTLPNSIAKLRRLNAIELRNTRWDDDVAVLITSIKRSRSVTRRFLRRLRGVSLSFRSIHFPSRTAAVAVVIPSLLALVTWYLSVHTAVSPQQHGDTVQPPPLVTPDIPSSSRAQLQTTPTSSHEPVAEPPAVLPFFMTHALVDKDLEGKTATDLELMRNEIFARHGRKFDREDLQEYFERQPWYRARYEPEEFPIDLLTEIQRANVKMLWTRAKQKP